MGALLTGFGLGFVVAAVLGPTGLLCMRTVLRGSLAGGLAIGLGAAVVDATYATLGSLGAGELLARAGGLRTAIGLGGAALLAWLGVRTLHAAFRVRLGGEAVEEVATPRRAFLTSLAATASNPSTILSWTAVFAAARTAGADGPTGLLVLGVFCGTLTWFAAFSGALALARRRFSERLLPWVDGVAGAGLLGFAGVLGWRAAHE